MCVHFLTLLCYTLQGLVRRYAGRFFLLTVFILNVLLLILLAVLLLI